MALDFRTTVAKRNDVYAKIFLTGVSGSGKSYSALRLATGMADEIENIKGVRPNIIMFNTEYSRGYYYANEFQYEIWPTKDMTVTQADFTTKLYSDWINFQITDKAVDGVPPIIILDGVTPAWDYTKAMHAKVGGAFKDWARYLCPFIQ